MFRGRFSRPRGKRDSCKGVHCVDLGESFQTHIYLQNLASIQPRARPVKFARSSGRYCATGRSASRGGTGPSGAPSGAPGGPGTRRVVAKFWQIFGKCCSFFVVSAPIFASKYAFCSIFQNLPDSQAEFFEIWQNFANFTTFAKFKIFAEFLRKLLIFKPIFC